MGTVIYGAGTSKNADALLKAGTYTTMKDVGPYIECNNNVFGDPAPGKAKSCYCGIKSDL